MAVTLATSLQQTYRTCPPAINRAASVSMDITECSRKKNKAYAQRLQMLP